jgi:predicted phosphodiesterase
MKLAALSDIHGNYHAFRAVLDDLAAQGGADRYWFLGDLTLALSRPKECLEAIRELQAANPYRVEVIGGNNDRYLVTGARRPQTARNEMEWGMAERFLQFHHDNALFTLTRTSWEDAQFLMKTIGRELTLDIPGYGTVLGCHGSPGSDETNIQAETTDSELLDMLTDSEGRMLICGHTHKPMDRKVGRWHIVNIGSIGLPFDGDNRASYAILTFENGAVSVDIRRVSYDIEAASVDLKALNHPNADYWIGLLRKGTVQLS